ncbi:MAG TPA: phosphonate C-P lyase system protein PhnH [Methylomirabilota bacterium]|nr:phosphonate C-P lyase system protein PhnH [Methylomirabilota bacterium]
MSLRAGLVDPVLDAQRVFRGVLDAMAHPGRVVALAGTPQPPAPLGPGAAAICLTLLDYETPLWVAPAARVAEVLDYLRFHCGAPIVGDPADAAFAVVPAGELPPLEAFAQGSDAYPDRSATLIVEVAGLAGGTGRRLRGPGIDGERRLHVRGAPERLWSMLVENHARFPRGVDLLLVAGAAVVALPRTTLVEP